MSHVYVKRRFSALLCVLGKHVLCNCWICSGDHRGVCVYERPEGGQYRLYRYVDGHPIYGEDE